MHGLVALYGKALFDFGVMSLEESVKFGANEPPFTIFTPQWSAYATEALATA
jgi:hypothetical protein